MFFADQHMVPLFVGTVARVLTFICVGTKFVALSDPRAKALATKPFVINEFAACTRGGTLNISQARKLTLRSPEKGDT